MPTQTRGLSRVKTIFQKEFREIFRDRRTLMSVVVGPLLITPLMFAIIGVGVQKRVDSDKKQKYSLGLLTDKNPAGIVDQLKKSPNFDVQVFGSEQEVIQKIKDRKISIGMKIDSDADQKLQAQQPIDITLISDPGEESSRFITNALQQAFVKKGKEIGEARLKGRGLSPAIIEPFRVKEQPIPGGAGAAMLFLTQMLPYMLIMAAFSGAIYAAFDQVAGEKERGTLETLLVSPASRRDIVLGKFSAVVSVCLVSCILSIVGLMIPFKSGLKAFEWLAQGGLSISPLMLGVVLLVLIPLSVLFAGMLLAISTFARNQKEAQTYLGSLFPIVLIPAFFSMFMGAKVSLSIALIPILNGSLIIKQALNGNFNAPFIALAFAASIGYAILSLGVATKMFQNEGVLIKT